MWKLLTSTQNVHPGDKIRYVDVYPVVKTETLFKVVKADLHYIEILPVIQNADVPANELFGKRIVKYFEPSSQSDLLIFNSKVEGKSTWARGIFISYSGFSGDALIAFRRGKRTSIIGMDGNDLMLILDGHVTLEDAIRKKSIKAVENNDFFVPLETLLHF